MSDFGTVPEGVDLSRPSIARVYDYFLGGFHNFPVDRELGERAVAVHPDMPGLARAGRAWLARVVSHLVSVGVKQFLDLGSGIPTAGNVHEIAQAIDPDVRVVYIDIEPVAVRHGEAILQDNPNASCVLADLREPDKLLSLAAVRGLLDPDLPTALLLSQVLHFLQDDDDPAGILARYRAALGPGSWLALSHATHEFQPEAARATAGLYDRTATPLRFRDRREVLDLLQGYDLVPPGLVLVEQWQPGTCVEVPDPYRYATWVGVARAT